MIRDDYECEYSCEFGTNHDNIVVEYKELAHSKLFLPCKPRGNRKHFQEVVRGQRNHKSQTAVGARVT